MSVCEEGRDHAFNSARRSAGRRWRFVMAGESLHSHGRKHQVDLERRRCHLLGFVASECIRTFSFSPTNPRWDGR